MTHNRRAQGAHPWEIHPLNQIKVSIWRFFPATIFFSPPSYGPKISWPWKRNLNLTKFDVAETSPHAFHQPTQMVSFLLIFTSKIGEMIHFDLSICFKKIGSTTTSNPPFSREKPTCCRWHHHSHLVAKGGGCCSRKDVTFDRKTCTGGVSDEWWCNPIIPLGIGIRDDG